MNEWISVKDRLPEKSGGYLVFDGTEAWCDGFDVEVGKFGEWFDDGTEKFLPNNDITHWAELPPPPPPEVVSTSWKSQIEKGDYRIQFETNDYEKFKIVERACCAAIDLEKLKRFVQKPPEVEG